MLETQRLAVLVIGDVIHGGRNLNAVLAETLERHPSLTAQQRGALTDLAYGTLRFGLQLEAVLQQLLTKPLTDGVLRELLWVALYQLQYTHAAPYAIVDHAVRCATALGAPHGGGLVNAVLRNFLRRREALLAVAARTEASRYAYPQWWVDKIHAQYPQRSAAILAAGNQHPPFTLRVNRRRTTRDEYLQVLAQQNIAATATGVDGVILAQAVPVASVPGFSAGVVSVQDAGAQLAAPLLEVHDGMRVLDACAAPGGKTLHLLECAEIELTALDHDAGRLKRVEQNLARLQLAAQVTQGDAAAPETWWDGKPFQRIVADVPCSASGVVRRHPDIKWLRRSGDIAQFAAQQQRLLEVLWRLLASGGKFLYTTCSIFQEENTRQIVTFLERHPDAQPLPCSGITTAEGIPEGQLLPDHEHDGFFYALLQKS